MGTREGDYPQPSGDDAANPGRHPSRGKKFIGNEDKVIWPKGKLALISMEEAIPSGARRRRTISSV
jgi:hypothetical protein